MYGAIRRAIANLTAGEDAERHFNLAAERIQSALLQVNTPVVDGVEFGVYAEPARLVGGDYLDVFPASDRSFVFGLGDASGKSLAAALNSLMLRYLVRGLVTALGTQELVRIVTHTNEVVTDDISDETFITFLLGAYDATSGALRIVNAGHEPPLVYRKETDAVQTIDVHDIVLGVRKETNYQLEETSLQPGDVAVFYTDGLTEATNDRGELYTVDRLKQALFERSSLPAQELAMAIFDAVKRYSAAPLRDDATIFVLQRTQNEGAIRG